MSNSSDCTRCHTRRDARPSSYCGDIDLVIGQSHRDPLVLDIDSFGNWPGFVRNTVVKSEYIFKLEERRGSNFFIFTDVRP